MNTKSRMGNTSKLSQLSGIDEENKSESTSQPQTSAPEGVSELNPKEVIIPKNEQLSLSITEEEVVVSNKPQSKSKEKQKSSKRTAKKLVAINIKIPQTHKEWLAKTASKVRDNNIESVPAGERVFPQHLVVVAIELLKKADVDWTQINNTEDLRQVLNLDSFKV